MFDHFVNIRRYRVKWCLFFLFRRKYAMKTFPLIFNFQVSRILSWYFLSWLLLLSNYLLFNFLFFLQDIQDSHIEHNDFLSVGGNQDQSAPIAKTNHCWRIFISSPKPRLQSYALLGLTSSRQSTWYLVLICSTWFNKGFTNPFS